MRHPRQVPCHLREEQPLRSDCVLPEEPEATQGTELTHQRRMRKPHLHPLSYLGLVAPSGDALQPPDVTCAGAAELFFVLVAKNMRREMDPIEPGHVEHRKPDFCFPFHSAGRRASPHWK